MLNTDSLVSAVTIATATPTGSLHTHGTFLWYLQSLLRSVLKDSWVELPQSLYLLEPPCLWCYRASIVWFSDHYLCLLTSLFPSVAVSDPAAGSSIVSRISILTSAASLWPLMGALRSALIPSPNRTAEICIAPHRLEGWSHYISNLGAILLWWPSTNKPDAGLLWLVAIRVRPVFGELVSLWNYLEPVFTQGSRKIRGFSC